MKQTVSEVFGKLARDAQRDAMADIAETYRQAERAAANADRWNKTCEPHNERSAANLENVARLPHVTAVNAIRRKLKG